jgi:hypothetical protein
MSDPDPTQPFFLILANHPPITGEFHRLVAF